MVKDVMVIFITIVVFFSSFSSLSLSLSLSLLPSLSSIEYWFRCMDLDGDGVLSMYELEYFYTEQVSKMDALGIETMVFEDCLCQVCSMRLDAVVFSL